VVDHQTNVADRQPGVANPRPRRLALLAIPLLSTTFGFVSGTAVDEQVPSAVFGLVWGVVVMLLAPRLARRGAQSPASAHAPLYLMCALAFMSLGGGILGELLSPTTQSEFEMAREPAFGLYFASIHLTFEWLLLPAALILNWSDHPRRYLLLIAALSFYVMRMLSAVYFAPTAMDWTDLPDATLVTGNLEAEVERWTTLNRWVRGPFQEWLVTALLVAATVRNRARPGQRLQ
jgi:hypothetical protein